MADLHTDSRNRRGAFTLVELLIVMTIMTILIGLVVGLSSFASRKAAVSRAAAEIQRLSQAIDEYAIANNTFPKWPSAFPWTYDMATEVEFEALTNYDSKVVFEDPWGRSYKIDIESRHNFRVWSDGMDASTDDDDIDGGTGF
ncbi:MAG: type II secretion system protein GspG [Verrucomicrobia bacterium]|nr:type II secretion system protein GspG [Verrucomicrobiota bacterium]